MKREMELIRKMLIAVEDLPGGWAPAEMKFDGYTEDQVGYHAYLLVDAGLARGADVTSNMSKAPEYELLNLTWAGHEFCDAARDDTRWKKAMWIVKEKGGHVTLEILKELLVSLMKGAFGLM
jgi:hypothetical protein